MIALFQYEEDYKTDAAGSAISTTRMPLVPVKAEWTGYRADALGILPLHKRGE